MRASFLALFALASFGSRPLVFPATVQAQVVDSIFPPEVELARFRATIAGQPNALQGGATSRARLIRGFVKAIETRDSLALGQLLLSKAEFAYLYFPFSQYMKPPYRQKPSLVWFQLNNATDRGAHRTLTRDGGKSLGYIGYKCPTEALVQERNRIWRDCVLRVSSGGLTRERRLFGSIIERGGRYKFMTYASEY